MAVAKPLIDGMTWKQVSERLGGLSRQRVFQLHRAGTLRARLNGVDVRKEATQKRKHKTSQKYLDILKQRRFGESERQLAKRFGTSPAMLYAYSEAVPFADERKLIEARKQVVELERKLGLS